MFHRIAALTVGAALLIGLSSPAAAQGASANVSVSASVQGGYLNLARVNGSSDVVFPNTEITTSTQTVLATQTPTFTITDATGTRGGWHLTLQSSNFSSGSNHINASNALFDGTAGATADFVLIAGDALDSNNGPRDTQSPAMQLNTAKKVVYAVNGWGAGTYTWHPTPSKFRLQVPPTTKAGGTTYTATYTLTLLSGP